MRGTAWPASRGSSAGEPSRPGLAESRKSECRGLVEALRGMGVAPPARRYDAGEDIFREGEPGDGLYVLAGGLAKLSKGYSLPGAKAATLRLVGPWEVFGDLAPGLPVAQGAGARALTACQAIKIPKVFVERAARSDRGVSLRLLTLLGLEVAHQKELVGCLLPRTTDARLAVLLPILAREFGEAANEESSVVLPRLTHEELGAMVASTRESVTHVLMVLRERGLLGIERGRIRILEPEGLAKVARRPYFSRG